ncbi:uncharacterized protein LOC109858332 isoform X3 [Pseudomyrmex gracilis]|uniref:uncharacterized protein LOC109858332 isoform X3 n=1 Tax=Pseudomyrmex gracilis TaxID=219809 RepID=UPI0009957262|nr:uncharacterized protein LOC109858332 isoform X3 [Pseudomyrmex gracilis]
MVRDGANLFFVQEESNEKCKFYNTQISKKEVSIRAQWLHACKLSDKDNVTHVYICSDHFIQSDYRHSTDLLCQKKWLLKPEAVPSVGVLNRPATKLQFQSTFKNVIQEKRHDNEQQKLYATPKKRRFAEPRYISEITTSDFSSPKRARRVINMVNKTYKEKCNLIHNLQKKNQALCKRITTLEKLVTHLRKEVLMSEEDADTLMVQYQNIIKILFYQNIIKWLNLFGFIS